MQTLRAAFVAVLALAMVRAGEFVPAAGDDLIAVKADCGAAGDASADDTAALREVSKAGRSKPGKHGNARQPRE